MPKILGDVRESFSDLPYAPNKGFETLQEQWSFLLLLQHTFVMLGYSDGADLDDLVQKRDLLFHPFGNISMPLMLEMMSERASQY